MTILAELDKKFTVFLSEYFEWVCSFAQRMNIVISKINLLQVRVGGKKSKWLKKAPKIAKRLLIFEGDKKPDYETETYIL